jgi:hypothetical protein
MFQSGVTAGGDRDEIRAAFAGDLIDFVSRGDQREPCIEPTAEEQNIPPRGSSSA